MKIKQYYEVPSVVPVELLTENCILEGSIDKMDVDGEEKDW